MNYETLVDAHQLQAKTMDWVIVDCRFDLAAPAAGKSTYLQAHIPGAVYAHLNDDLSGPLTAGSGRHPLPSADEMNRLFGRLGIQAGSQVVVYDDAGGSICARLWWMLSYMGHTRVAVLDGGWPAWVAAGYAVTSGVEQNRATQYHGQPRSDRLVTLEQIAGVQRLVDSRDPARFRGDNEPIDPQAGHIPGAINHFWKHNIGETGQFKDPSTLGDQFKGLTGKVAVQDLVFYCGSGVTACNNILAMVHAGVGEPRLYAGSWSEWCADTSRPVATGDES